MQGTFRHWLVVRLARLAAPAALAASLVSAPLSPALASSPADGGEEGGAPPGQLVRRGLSGPVVDVGGSSITVATRHGKVEVRIVPGKTIIRKPPEGIVGIDAINVGDKVAVLLEKPVVQEPEPQPSPEPTVSPTPEPTETPEAGEQGEGGTTDETEGDDGTEGTEAPDTETPEDSTEGQADEGESPDDLDDETELEDEAAEDVEEEASDDSSDQDDSSEEASETPSPDEGTEAGEGDQAGGEEDEADGEEDEQPQVLRSATALKVLVVPGKATRTHAHAIVKGIEKGKLQVIGRDGQVVLLDDTSGQGGLVESGDDVVLIVRGKDGSHGQYEVRGAMRASDLKERLQEYAQRLETKGKKELVERFREKAQKYEQQLQERLEKLRARASDQTAAEIDKALEKLRHKGQQALQGGEDNDTGGHGHGGNRGPRGKDR